MKVGREDVKKEMRSRKRESRGEQRIPWRSDYQRASAEFQHKNERTNLLFG